jgi:ribosome-binding ATPase
MKTAIFGFAGSGKSDLFAALAGEAAAKAGNRGMAKVPEPRLDPLVALYTPKKTTYSEIEYLDIPGGGGKGDGLGLRVLNDIRPSDCLLCVLDAFSELYDPREQWQSVEADLLVADMAVAEKRLERIGLDKKKNRDLIDPKEEEALIKAMAHMEKEELLRTDPELAADPALRGFKFLSAKPIVYAWNCAETDVASFQTPDDATGQTHLAVSAKLERELAELADPEERAMFLADLGLTESALNRVIKKTYQLMGLISFFTAGEDEVRAWALRKDSLAPIAAGVIHSDIQKGFIRAEVLGYDDFIKAGDFKKAKELGLFRLEGKEYRVHDGDIIEFRFNV